MGGEAFRGSAELARPSMDPDEALPIIAQQKSMTSWSGWQVRNNHVNHRIAVGSLSTLDKVSIAGLTVELEVKADLTAVSCLFLFSIMKLRGRDRVPVYQLEVASRQKRTHNGLTTIYGPHEHVGSSEPTAVTHSKVDCSSWNDCLEWFLDRTAIHGFQGANPYTI